MEKWVNPVFSFLIDQPRLFLGFLSTRGLTEAKFITCRPVEAVNRSVAMRRRMHSAYLG